MLEGRLRRQRRRKKLVTIINGSPRTNGSTAFIISKILDGLNIDNSERTTFCLGQMKINYCIGCKECYKTGTCIQNDDVNTIIQSIYNSDLIVIGSPSYWGDITGQLKVFFDRNTPFSDTNKNLSKVKIPTDKKGISVAIRAGTTERENTHIIDSIEHYFGHLGIIPIGSFSCTGVDTFEDLMKREDYIGNAFEYGNKLKTSL